MTSPFQLKYLDAIGIPVWVSRDIISDSNDSQGDADQAALNQELIASQSPSQDTTHLSSAEHIMQSLDQSSSPAVNHHTIHTPNTVPVKPATEHAVTAFDRSAPTQNEIARTASHIIFASGSTNAKWMIIGESPELSDDRNNQPYPSDSGILLDNMLRAVGIENIQSDAYKINIIKATMQPVAPESIGELNQILGQKVTEIQPKIILIVGQLSAQNILQSKEPLARLRGKALKHPETGIDIIVTYYPTHLLSKPMDKRKAWDDLKLAMQLIGDTPI